VNITSYSGAYCQEAMDALLVSLEALPTADKVANHNKQDGRHDRPSPRSVIKQQQ
jgi:hypothetical protein